MEEELQAAIDKLKKAIIRENVIGIVYRSTAKQRAALSAERQNTSRLPTNLEKGTTQGMWGLKHYLRAVELETNAAFVEYTRLVAIEAIDQYKAERKARRDTEAPRRRKLKRRI